MHILRKHICSLVEIHKGFFMLSMILILLAFPVTAISQTLAWEPLTMQIIQVPIGGTGYQILTLTNAGPGDPLTIDNVEFTYNQQGVYEFTTSEALPAVLLVGESMDVIFSFTPIDISFAGADIMVTNDSLNAPNLYYSVMGEGIESNPCDPLDYCGGQCVDTLIDVDHCGGCNNECPPVDNGTVSCVDGSCSYTCNEGYEWDGDSCELIVSQTPLEMLQDLIAFIESAKDGGTIVGFGPGNSGEDRYDQFMDWLTDAEELLTADSINEACGQLRSAQLRTDGGYPFQLPPDFIAGEDAGEINDSILEIMAAIGEMYPWANCEPREPNSRPGQY